MSRRKKSNIKKFAKSLDVKLLKSFIDAFEREPIDSDVIDVVDADLFHIMICNSTVFAFVSEFGVVHSYKEFGYEKPPYYDSMLKVIER